MPTLKLGQIAPDGRIKPANALAAEFLAAVESGDVDRQREILTRASGSVISSGDRTPGEAWE
jgi:hypothetical protein